MPRTKLPQLQKSVKHRRRRRKENSCFRMESGFCVTDSLRLAASTGHNIAVMIEKTGLSIPTTTAGIMELRQFGIVRELTGQKWKLFAYQSYLEALGA
jgi:hypothetical protein